MRSLDPQGDLAEVMEHATVYGPKGCGACGEIGYRGRLPVYEYLPIDRRLRGMIEDGVSEESIEQTARKGGFRTIRASALRRVAAGETSQSEILRVL
jgi:type II secretory ATPase GspE/PulE/Tfp pilus assembly ATPase PilB-like protein